MKQLITTLAFSTILLCSLAQNPVTQVSVSSEYVDLTSQQIAQMSPEELAANRQVFMVDATIGSASGVDKIAVMIGSTEGSNDIFYKEFEYGVSGEFPDGTSYSANGNHITFGTTVYGIHRQYVEVVAIMDNGSKSVPLRTTVN